MEIQSDLIFVHKGKDGEWIRCGDDVVVGAVKTSDRDFKRWEVLNLLGDDVPDFNVWIEGLSKEDLSPAMIKINVESEGFVLGRLNTLVAHVKELLERPDLQRINIVEVAHKFKNLAVEIMLGDSRANIKIQLLNQIRGHLKNVIRIDDSSNNLDLMADNLFSQMDFFIQNSDQDQFFSMIESEARNNVATNIEIDNDLDDDNASVRSMLEDVPVSSQFGNLQLFIRLIESEQNFNLSFAQILWDKIQYKYALPSDKQIAFKALLNYINKCPAETAMLKQQKENLIRSVVETGKQQFAQSNHLLSSFGVYRQSHSGEVSKNNLATPVKKPTN